MPNDRVVRLEMRSNGWWLWQTLPPDDVVLALKGVGARFKKHPPVWHIPGDADVPSILLELCDKYEWDIREDDLEMLKAQAAWWEKNKPDFKSHTSDNKGWMYE